MIIPGQVLAKAEKLNAENVSFVQSKDGFDVFRLTFKQSHVRHNGSDVPLQTGLPILLLYKDGIVEVAKSTDHEYWLSA